MISPARPLPIHVEVDCPLPQAAIEAIADLLLDATDAEDAAGGNVPEKRKE